MNDRPVAHRFSYVAIRWMGPQQCLPVNVCDPSGQNDLVGDFGRYPLHFHKNGDHSTGTLIDGVVVFTDTSAPYEYSLTLPTTANRLTILAEGFDPGVGWRGGRGRMFAGGRPCNGAGVGRVGVA